MEYRVRINNKIYNISTEEINDMMAAAFEGGINYWCDRAVPVLSLDGSYEGVSDEDHENIHYPSQILGYGGQLDIYELDTDDCWRLTLEKFFNGLQKHLEMNDELFTDFIELYDADDIDCIIQYALFEDLIFA